jgi:hypothetical protein
MKPHWFHPFLVMDMFSAGIVFIGKLRAAREKNTMLSFLFLILS